MKRIMVMLASALGLAGPLASQIRVNPNGVNVNSQGATTVFLTFGGVDQSRVPAEAYWCGELISAAPDLGSRCDPTTLFGQLPARYDLSRRSGTAAFTDIMSIPPSVARRAYQAAEEGANSAFYYVRHFRNTAGGPDEYVVVTCRMAGGGARVPLSLTNVQLGFAVETPVLFLETDATAPALEAQLTYNGTGRLKGRWEVVLPGEEQPGQSDLLTEASLPLELRGSQRRYTELSRFNVFLPPSGKYLLPGPDPSRIPTSAEGAYLILLRIEASDDKEGDSNLGAVGAGSGVVHSGAVAGFPLPVLRYFVGSGGSEQSPARVREEAVVDLLEPAERAGLGSGQPAVFRWMNVPATALYRLEIQNDEGAAILSALIPAGTTRYDAPPWLAERAAGKPFRWRVLSLDGAGRVIRRSGWREGVYR